MDIFWIIKSSFSLFDTKVTRNHHNIFDDFRGLGHSMAKKSMKKCPNLKMRTKMDYENIRQ